MQPLPPSVAGAGAAVRARRFFVRWLLPGVRQAGERRARQGAGDVRRRPHINGFPQPCRWVFDLIHEAPPSDAAGGEAAIVCQACGPARAAPGLPQLLKRLGTSCPAALPARVSVCPSVPAPHACPCGCGQGRGAAGSSPNTSDCKSITLQSCWAVSSQGCVQGGLVQLKSLPSSALVTPGKCS